MMNPFLVVWAKMMLLHCAKNCCFVSVSVLVPATADDIVFDFRSIAKPVSAHIAK